MIKLKKKKRHFWQRGNGQECKVTHIPCDVSVAGKVTGEESGKSGLFHVSNRFWD